MSAVISRRKGGRASRGARSSSSNSKDPIGQYASDAWSLAKRTAAGLNEIRKFINIEEKYTEATFAATFDYNGTITSISQIAQGTNINQRVGDSVRIQHIELRFTSNADASALTTALRVIVFRDLDGYGTIPTMANLLEVTGSVNTVNSPFNKLNLTRFSILYDETLTICNAGPAQVVGVFKTSHQGHIRYLGTTAAAASDGKGTVYVAICSDRVTTLLPTMNFATRINYTDD